MSHWLPRIMLVCVLLGTYQWCYMHPDAKFSIAMKGYITSAEKMLDGWLTDAGLAFDTEVNKLKK